jgi:hypothetical protein
MIGLDIYMGGTGFQQFFIFVFGFFIFQLWRIMRGQIKGGKSVLSNSEIQSGLTLIYALAVVLLLITVSYSPPAPMSVFANSLRSASSSAS